MAAACLDAVEVAHVGAVLEDSIEQLTIMGYLMPYGKTSGAKGRGKTMPAAEAGVSDILNRQDNLDTQFAKVMDLNRTRTTEMPDSRESFITELRLLATKLQGTNALAGGRPEDRGSQATKENMVKLHKHRESLQGVLEDLLAELKTSGSYSTLVAKAEAGAVARQEEEFLVKNESEGREQLEALQKTDLALQLKAEEALLELNGKVALLKDQIQDQKAKLAIEEKYVKECLSESVTTSQDQQLAEEEQLHNQLMRMQLELETQTSNHDRTMELLKSLYEDYSQKLVHWSSKYDADTVRKQEELDALQTLKAADLEKLQDMTEKYKEYSALVEEDRLIQLERERQRVQAIKEECAASNIQVWWQYMMRRHKLGPYKKKKKKGKGSGKKKGKKGGKKKKK